PRSVRASGLPGSASYPFATTYASPPAAFRRTVRSFSTSGKPAPPRPRRPLRSTIARSSSSSSDRARARAPAAAPSRSRGAVLAGIGRFEHVVDLVLVELVVRGRRALAEAVAEPVRDRDRARRARLLAHEAGLALEDARLGLEEERDQPTRALRKVALLVWVLPSDRTWPDEVVERPEHARDDPEHLPIHVAEDDVDRAEDGDGVGDEPSLEQPRQGLQVHERGTAH